MKEHKIALIFEHFFGFCSFLGVSLQKIVHQSLLTPQFFPEKAD